MAADDDPAGRNDAIHEQGATFDLERFGWDAPDCLAVTGRFAGLGEPPDGEPVLVHRSADREHRLPAVAETLSGPPEDGRPWQASFVWQEPPVAFEPATLALGEDVTVDLPDPGASRPRLRPRTLDVRRAQTAAAVAAPGEEGGHASSAGEERPADIERLRLEADLLAAQEQAREASFAAERADLDERERGQIEAALVELAAARTATEETRADAERVLTRLTTIIDALSPRE